MQPYNMNDTIHSIPSDRSKKIKTVVVPSQRYSAGVRLELHTKAVLNTRQAIAGKDLKKPVTNRINLKVLYIYLEVWCEGLLVNP